MNRQTAHDDAPAAAPATRTDSSAEIDPLGLAAAGQARELMGAAEAGVAGSGQALPHGEVIQQAFGHHDLGGISAHVGGSAALAAQTLGAQAYATGQALAFAEPPDLHTAAHEAAHAVQQRSGGGAQVAAWGGFGRPGDAHEQHADAVADAVVDGRSAEALLDASPAGSPGVQLKEKTTLADKVAAYGETLTEEASAAVSGGLAAQEHAPVPVRLGRTVLPDPTSGELMARYPQRLGELADLVVGGRAVAAAGRAEHRRDGWEAVDPVGEASRVVLPGERARFRDAEGAPQPLVGREPGRGKGKYDAIKFETAATPLGEAATAWAEERRRRQENAEGHALGLSIAAADGRQPFAAYSIPVEVPGMAAGRPLYIYDFLESAYDTVVTHGDLGGADALALRGAVLDAAGNGLVPAVQGTRILSFEALGGDEIAGWVAEVGAADRARVEARIATQLEGAGAEGLAGLSDREIMQASGERRIEMVERVMASVPSGDGEGKALVAKLLATMSGGTFEAMCERFVTGGQMNAFGHWVDGDAELMWLFGERLIDARIIYSRTVLETDGEGESHSVAQGCMLWVGNNPTWGGSSKHIDFAGKECTVQIGDRGLFGDLADVGRMVHGTWKQNTAGSREYVVGAFMSGAVDFLADAGIGTLDMLDRPAEVANALYTAAQNPGETIIAIEHAIGKASVELWEAAIEAGSGGDATEYAYLCGRYLSGIISAVAGVVGLGKGMLSVVKGLRQLSPRNIGMYLRSLLQRSGRLRPRRAQGKGVYQTLRGNPALMRRVGTDAAHLDDSILAARTARSTADDAARAAETAEDVAQAQTLATEAARAAAKAEQKLAVRRAQLGRMLHEQGVVGAEVMRPEQLVKFAKALADDGLDTKQLTALRRELLGDLAGGATQIEGDPAAFSLAVSNEANTLKKSLKRADATQTAEQSREKLRAMYELNDFKGVSELDDQQLIAFSSRFNPHALGNKVRPIKQTAQKLRGGDLTPEQIEKELVALADKLDKRGLASEASAVRRCIESERDFGYFAIDDTLDGLADRATTDAVASAVTQGRTQLAQTRMGLLAKNKTLDHQQMREAITKAMSDRGMLDLFKSEKARFGVDDISNRAFVDGLPDEVVVRLFGQLRESKFGAFEAGIKQAKTQGLKQTLGKIDELEDLRHGANGAIHPKQNVATADIDIEGIDPRLTAVSGADAPAGTVMAPEQRIFKTTRVGHDRIHDSEAKILEAIAHRLGDNPDAKGSITLVSERPCCPSCLGVIQQFRERYPHITLTVESGL